MTLLEEVIQVAAVAVAIAEDLIYGESHFDAIPNGYDALGSQGKEVLDMVMAERRRQDEKWGKQHHDPTVWMAILMEEVGEAAAEVEAVNRQSLLLITDIVWAGDKARHWFNSYVPQLTDPT